MHLGRRSLLALGLLLPAAGLVWTIPAAASAQSAGHELVRLSSPRDLIARYFTYLERKQYYAAYRLTAPCAVTFRIPNPDGAPPGEGGLGPRVPWAMSPEIRRDRAKYGWFGVVAFRVFSIRQFFGKRGQPDQWILRHYHYLEFEVSAWMKFAYPPLANNKRLSGQHVAKVILYQCHHDWYIDPDWIEGTGGPFTWV